MVGGGDLHLIARTPYEAVDGVYGYMTPPTRDFPRPDLGLISALWEHSGSVVRVLDSRSSLTGVTALWSLSKTHLS